MERRALNHTSNVKNENKDEFIFRANFVITKEVLMFLLSLGTF